MRLSDMLGDLFLISLTVGIIIGLFLILGPVLRKRYVLARMYLVWLILALRLLVPFRFELPQAPVELEVLPPAGMAEQVQTVPVQPPQEKSVTAGDVLPCLWAAGTVGVLGWNMGAYFVFRRRVKPSLVEVEPPRRGEPGVYCTGRIRGPMMLGYVKPMILLPEVEYTPEETEAVLTHERAHYRRGDVWYKLILLLACGVHWFNPMVWLMARRAGQDMEFACDEAVIRRRGQEYRKEYSKAILKSAERSDL